MTEVPTAMVCFYLRPLNLESKDVLSIHVCLGFIGKQNGQIPDKEEVRKKVNNFTSSLACVTCGQCPL